VRRWLFDGKHERALHRASQRDASRFKNIRLFIIFLITCETLSNVFSEEVSTNALQSFLADRQPCI
jgi:hypothetical protein